MYGGLSSAECDEVISEINKENFDLNKIIKRILQIIICSA